LKFFGQAVQDFYFIFYFWCELIIKHLSFTISRCFLFNIK
jgi:hypothetical protein